MLEINTEQQNSAHKAKSGNGKIKRFFLFLNLIKMKESFK